MNPPLLIYDICYIFVVIVVLDNYFFVINMDFFSTLNCSS